MEHEITCPSCQKKITGGKIQSFFQGIFKSHG